MYNRADQQEVLRLLRKIDEKLEALSAGTGKSSGDTIEAAAEFMPDVDSAAFKQTPPAQASAKNAEQEQMVWDLTRLQYELSNEMLQGVQKLKQMIQDGEKHTTMAKGKYQK